MANNQESNIEQTIDKVNKLWPEYFEKFELPETARDDCIKVFRMCKSSKCDHESFMCTYEENGFKCLDEDEEADPSTYSMSVYYDFKDIKRFKNVNRPPCEIAMGHTNPERGKVSITREWNKSKYYKRSSHTDYWLYQDAKPELDFEIIDFDSYLDKWHKEREEKINNGKNKF